MVREIFMIRLKHVSDHLSVLFPFAWLYLYVLKIWFGVSLPNLNYTPLNLVHKICLFSSVLHSNFDSSFSLFLLQTKFDSSWIFFFAFILKQVHIHRKPAIKGILRETNILWNICNILNNCFAAINNSRLSIITIKSSVIRQNGESQNGFLKKTKHAKFSEKRTFLTLWYATSAYQG